MTLFYFECPQALGISRVDRWNNFYLSALTEYDKNWQECPHAKFLLTRLLRGATETNRNIDSVKFISTHTPLARRDGVIWRTSEAILNFYSHASCEARPSLEKEITDSENFYSHASCEARPLLRLHRNFILTISTHTPLARRDNAGGISHSESSKFLLTRLLRGATRVWWTVFMNLQISTHTPFARRDTEFPKEKGSTKNFYSHASCEARHWKTWICAEWSEFLLTRPMRGATQSD